jgi:hypothetical protein
VLDEHNHASFAMKHTLQAWTFYHVFGFFWTFQFILAFQETVLAGCVASWYFTKPKGGKKPMNHFTISKTIYRTLRYSVGSLLFGSVLVAIVQLLRLLVKVFEKEIEDQCGGGSHTIKFVIKCVDCCLYCLQKCLKFLNRNAYIEVALTGKSFCTCAQRAFQLLLRNALRVAAINSVGDLVLFVAKLLISGLMVFFAFIWFERIGKNDDVAHLANIANASNSTRGGTSVDAGERLNGAVASNGMQYEAPVALLVGLLAWLVASVFLGVYEVVIDTIFLCFCEDTERNNGTVDRPYFMSRALLKCMAEEEKHVQKQVARQHNQIEATHNKSKSLNLDPSHDQNLP